MNDEQQDRQQEAGGQQGQPRHAAPEPDRERSGGAQLDGPQQSGEQAPQHGQRDERPHAAELNEVPDAFAEEQRREGEHVEESRTGDTTTVLDEYGEDVSSSPAERGHDNGGLGGHD